MVGTGDELGIAARLGAAAPGDDTGNNRSGAWDCCEKRPVDGPGDTLLKREGVLSGLGWVRRRKAARLGAGGTLVQSMKKKTAKALLFQKFYGALTTSG